MKTIKLFTVLLIWIPNAIHAQDSVKTKKIKEVIIENKTNGNSIDEMNAMRVERLSKTELSKNACCNLAESFESNASVDLGNNGAFGGAKQVEMLGLNGQYVQTINELLPNVRGLNYTYGFNDIPGTFVQSIYINKGPGSVTNGFESMTGQIDVEYHKPESYKPRLFLNGYVNTNARTELNANFSTRVNPEWSTLTALHGSFMQSAIDRNKDSYYDIPKYKMGHLLHRWKYEGKKVESIIGATAHWANRESGQLESIREISNPRYDINMNSKRLEAFTKTSYRFSDHGYKSLGVQLDFNYQKDTAHYGLRTYGGEQNTFFGNVIYQTPLIHNDHLLKVGGGILLDQIKQGVDHIYQNRVEPVSGLFAEYTYLGNEKVSVILGARADYNARIDKFFFTPRFNLKYELIHNLIARVSAGSGFRTATIFPENTRFMASNRKIIIPEILAPEQSWNYGMNLTYNFYQSGKDSRISLDIFRTDFVNQVIADYDHSPQEIWFYNLNSPVNGGKGKSFSWYAQLEWYYELFKNFDVRLAYKFNDVKQTQFGKLQQRTLNPAHRALANFSYKTKNKKWEFDFTTQWVGSQRLPDYSSNPESLRPSVGTRAPSYFRLLGQTTYVFSKQFEVYLGGENLTNYRQQELVIDTQNPYGPYFDGGTVWGPSMGRVVYAGFRYTLLPKVKL